ncbi:flagellar basal-body rod protein FlgG [bacterium]|nr:flagellar basal-body rod protein FlgG [bacterium]
MISQLHMAKTAMFAFQRKLQVIVNNISNSQTVGFKRRSVEMESVFPLVLESAISEGDDAVGSTTNSRKKYIEYGQGVRIADIRKDMTRGSIEITNQPLDLAIDGEGMFQFRNPDGKIQFSRAGNLHMDSEGNIVNPNGNPLEPAIRLPREASEIIINDEGKVFVQTNGDPTPREVGQIMVAVFPNPQGLKDIGQNMFEETTASGTPTFEIPGRQLAGAIRQRALEFSNVNVIEEMMNMVLCQRAFDITVKAINSGDSMLKSGSDLGK